MISDSFVGNQSVAAVSFVSGWRLSRGGRPHRNVAVEAAFAFASATVLLFDLRSDEITR